MNLFVDDSLVWIFLRQLDRVRNLGRIRLISYVVIKNHVHLVIDPLGTSVDRILFSLKQPVARKALAYLQNAYPDLHKSLLVRVGKKWGHRFWLQGGGYDSILRDPDHARQVIRYNHRNPVRKEWVKSPDQYPWSSFRAYATGEPDPIRIDRPDWV